MAKRKVSTIEMVGGLAGEEEHILPIDMEPGTAQVVEETDDYQRVVTRSEAGWVTELKWKPGREPVPEPTETDRLHDKIALLTDKLATIGVITPEDADEVKTPRNGK